MGAEDTILTSSNCFECPTRSVGIHACFMTHPYLDVQAQMWRFTSAHLGERTSLITTLSMHGDQKRRLLTSAEGF